MGGQGVGGVLAVRLVCEDDHVSTFTGSSNGKFTLTRGKKERKDHYISIFSILYYYIGEG